MTLLAVLLWGMSLTGCGARSTAKSSGTVASTRSPGQLRGDGDEDGKGALVKERAKADADSDSDNEGSDYYDWDDSQILIYGHPASVADVRAIEAAVDGYYAAAAAGDGARACALISKGLLATVRREFGAGSGPLALGGKTCAALMSRLLRRLHSQVTAYGRSPMAAVARVAGNKADVLLTAEGTRPNRYTLARRERGGWKVDSLLDMGLP